MATPQLATFKVPAIENEPMVSGLFFFYSRISNSFIALLKKSYAPGSAERHALAATIAQMEQDLPFEVPCIINGVEVCNHYSYNSYSAKFFLGQDRQNRQTTLASRSRTSPLHLSRSR